MTTETVHPAYLKYYDPVRYKDASPIRRTGVSSSSTVLARYGVGVFFSEESSLSPDYLLQKACIAGVSSSSTVLARCDVGVFSEESSVSPDYLLQKACIAGVSSSSTVLARYDVGVFFSEEPSLSPDYLLFTKSLHCRCEL